MTGLLTGSVLGFGSGFGKVGSDFPRKSLSILFRPIYRKESRIVKREIAIAKSLLVLSPENVQVDVEPAGPQTQVIRGQQYPTTLVRRNLSPRTMSFRVGFPSRDREGLTKWKWNFARIINRYIRWDRIDASTNLQSAVGFNDDGRSFSDIKECVLEREVRKFNFWFDDSFRQHISTLCVHQRISTIPSSISGNLGSLGLPPYLSEGSKSGPCRYTSEYSQNPVGINWWPILRLLLGTILFVLGRVAGLRLQ